MIREYCRQTETDQYILTAMPLAKQAVNTARAVRAMPLLPAVSGDGEKLLR
jgi:hypothetical protein